MGGVNSRLVLGVDAIVRREALAETQGNTTKAQTVTSDEDYDEIDGDDDDDDDI